MTVSWGYFGRNALALVALLSLSACESGRFYTQAVSGHVDLMMRRKPIAKILATESTPLKLRLRLALIQELLTFAETRLSLSSAGSYRCYVELDRRYVTWNVAVSPEFSLEPKSWWYPIVGRLEHRGYFREASAQRFARRMTRRGYDVSVGGVDAYSTLGWFRDPVLSTFIELDEVELADLIFHELAHQELFISGDTDFNEAYAVAVAELGVMAWLGTRDGELVDQFRRHRAAMEGFMAWVIRLRRALETSYEQGRDQDWNDALRRSRKEAIVAAFREEFQTLMIDEPALRAFQGWVQRPINNARINALETYYELVPAFRRLLSQAASWDEFFDQVRELGKVPKSNRRERLLAASGLVADAGRGAENDDR